ncbi:4-alpha-glucanotransferase [Chitinophaga terrae (ex Kim and Jung 2007)]|uniref:4-alpha-glucanotransferase n=1 Tax=Chitinophaga terrae (ex Kim and Jung 2007) TaxID=408074 RepID=A0A1H3WUB4_9BACT|nr:4-alpha-glucanotransferase [Chitinophaga terrae (ex Kim and Jung 2007)]MDQ0107061.1 4-alpha-glucanotransferase [Chitinophaga terrae (ex Kim and Jung 2007)]GEP90307.1 4-alpha-glucanotransferase [Chitinophaga terrae (ex Kim and Jung 2007)]SDZ90719.1 4-alpha-glucanotransferase [Chitinophaga terrae (ex Kim and Jung 2007)]
MSLATRKAGILLHITSLPGPFAMGDIGPAAYAFARKLHKSGQRIWQMLPVNPIDPSNASPYSALSAMAGNILLISPELLAKDGLLDEKTLDQYKHPSTSRVDFDIAARHKIAMLETAWQTYTRRSFPELQEAFETFCKQESDWLQDYVTHKALTVKYGGKPWWEWSAADRKKTAKLTGNHAVIARKEQWWQFIFDRQWTSLKKYCQQLGIQLLGDLPFYISHTASDVWSEQEMFHLDTKGAMTFVAGVPPDYFNAEGQRWNMPVYNWEAMKAANYEWWLKRIKRNMHWFDLLRLDHFRAFSAYWNIPADKPTAKEGTWQPGPGGSLLKAMKDAFPSNPFVAEDLGDIDQPVLDLRDEFSLPGMKVLQFAFGDDMPESPHIPHQYPRHCYAYTGTHDNNTTKGWWKEEAGMNAKQNLRQYAGVKPVGKKVHLLLGKMLYASVADNVIMPMQDVLGLGSASRMNTPAGAGQHWSWRMLPGAFDKKRMKRLKKWTLLYNR